MHQNTNTQIENLINLLREKLMMEEELHFCIVGLLNDLVQEEKDRKQLENHSNDETKGGDI